MNDYVAVLQMIVTVAAVTAIHIRCRRFTAESREVLRCVNDLQVVMTDLAHVTVVLASRMQRSQQYFERIGQCLNRLERDHRMLPAESELDLPPQIERDRVESTRGSSG